MFIKLIYLAAQLHVFYAVHCKSWIPKPHTSS